MVGDKMEKKATNQGASGGLPTGWASSQGPLPEASGEFLSGYISPWPSPARGWPTLHRDTQGDGGWQLGSPGFPGKQGTMAFLRR